MAISTRDALLTRELLHVQSRAMQQRSLEQRVASLETTDINHDARLKSLSDRMEGVESRPIPKPEPPPSDVPLQGTFSRPGQGKAATKTKRNKKRLRPRRRR